MFGGQCGSTGRYHILNTALVHLDDIRIPFHQKTVVLFGNGLFGKINAIEHLTFVVNLAFGRVQVFGSFLIIRQNTATKTEHPAAHGMDGEHDPPFETVERPVLAHCLLLDNGQPCFFQKLQLIPFIQGGFGKGLPLIQTIAKAKLFDGLVREPTFLEVRQPYGLSRFAFPKGLGKILLGIFRDQIHAFPLVGLLLLLIGLFGFLNLNIIFFGQVLYGFGIGKMFVLHQKSHHIPTFPATEILPYLLHRGNHETRGPFIRKRTQSLKIGP